MWSNFFSLSHEKVGVKTAAVTAATTTTKNTQREKQKEGDDDDDEETHTWMCSVKNAKMSNEISINIKLN